MIFYNSHFQKRVFELGEGRRPWDVFLVTTEGSFSYTIQGKEYLIEKNEIAYFPRDLLFRREILSPITIHQLAFRVENGEPYYGLLRPGKLFIPKSEVQLLADDLKRVMVMSDRRDIHKHYIRHMIVQNYVHGRRIEVSPTGPSEDIIAVINYIGYHIREKIDIDALAEMVHLSHVGLLWKFKRFTGQTISQYIIDLRMSLAKQLLSEGDQRINEIAALCGYSNPYYFSNVFREYYNMSPTQFRRAVLEGKASTLETPFPKEGSGEDASRIGYENK